MRKLIPVSVRVFALLVGFGLLLILADIVNPVTHTSIGDTHHDG